MGYNFFDYKTTFFDSFQGYILQGKNVCFYLQLIKEYIKDTISFENIAKERHIFRLIKNVGNH